MRNKLTQDRPTLFVDQYGQREWASSAKELREKCGGGRLAKMYVDGKDGDTIHVGYVVGHRWFNAFNPARVEEGR